MINAADLQNPLQGSMEQKIGKRNNRVSSLWEPQPDPPVSSPLPALPLPPHIFTFTEHSGAIAYFLCTDRMVVALHMLIKRRVQRGFKEKVILLLRGEQQSWRRKTVGLSSVPVQSQAVQLNKVFTFIINETGRGGNIYIYRHYLAANVMLYY